MRNAFFYFDSEGLRDFLADDFKPRTHISIAHGERDAEAFSAVTPTIIWQAEKEIIPRHDEDSAFFQDFIQLARCLFCSIQPEPKEESTLTFV